VQGGADTVGQPAHYLWDVTVVHTWARRTNCGILHYGLVAGLVDRRRGAFAPLRTPGLILGALGFGALCFVIGILPIIGDMLGRSHTLAFLTPVVAVSIVAGYAALGYVWLVLKFAPMPLIIRRGQRSRWRRHDTAIPLCAAALVLSLILSARLQDPARADVIAAIAVATGIVFGVTGWYAARATQGHP